MSQASACCSHVDKQGSTKTSVQPAASNAHHEGRDSKGLTKSCHKAVHYGRATEVAYRHTTHYSAPYACSMLTGAATDDSQSLACVGNRPIALSLCSPNNTWPNCMTQNSSRGERVSSLRSGSGGNTGKQKDREAQAKETAVQQPGMSAYGTCELIQDCLICKISTTLALA